jgi:2-oxoglutarate dehydrogenase E2 component (dihydrolipoamide succinyltransferase)
MATKVLVPRLGEGVEEVTVSKWLKQVGDTVRELEPLLEVNTDKVDTEIPAPVSGIVLTIEMPEGGLAKVGELLAIIGAVGENVEVTGLSLSASTSKVESSKLEKQPVELKVQLATSVKKTGADVGFISPIVARIAAEREVNLSQVRGTGLNGRITKNDVLDFVKTRDVTQNASRMHTQSKADGAQTASVVPSTTGDGFIKHSAIRRQIAEHMAMSQKTSPHVLTVMEADMSKVVTHRAANKETFAYEGVNLTFTAYFIAAIAAGLKAYPVTNSSWTEEGVLLHKAINVGMATSLNEEGLIVPVIKNADNLSLLATARAVNDLAYRARARKLQPEEVRGGTFTLTNHGISGSLFAFPIINQPQCGILGAGAIQKRVLVVDDAIAIRPMVYLSFAFDHRILDGASADRFLMKVKETLDNWS